MRAQQVVKLGALYELRDVEVPKPGRNQLLLKTQAAGLCHTDSLSARATPVDAHVAQMVRNDGFGDAKLPLTGSHEPSGIVEAVGEGVTGFNKGDRVGAVGTIGTDDGCADCQAGHRVFCDSGDFVGLGQHGAFADYVVVDSRSTFRVPDELSFSQVAPITCGADRFLRYPTEIVSWSYDLQRYPASRPAEGWAAGDLVGSPAIDGALTPK